jgi:hypothetical protein
MTDPQTPVLEHTKIEMMRKQGWIVCPPQHIPVPRTENEAVLFIQIGEAVLKEMVYATAT